MNGWVGKGVGVGMNAAATVISDVWDALLMLPTSELADDEG